MICSEFSAKTTIAALVELNDRLVGAAGRAIDKAVAANEMTPDEGVAAKEKLKLGNEKGINLVKIPFSKRERLKRVHPGRLITKLNRAGCLKKQPASPLHAQLLKN